MKKRKKNNKPLIILVVGLLVFGSLLGFGIYKVSEHKKFLVEDKKEFDKKIVEEKISCNEKIVQAKKDIEKLELDIEKIDSEITKLERQQTDEFMNSTGFSKKYYELEDKITAKRKEQAKKRIEISNKRSEITKLENTIWKIDNEWDSYRYKNPGYKNVLKSAYTEGPLEFVNYIKNAEYVVATSFHATVFSIIFNKKFFIVPHKKTGARVTNLLDKLEIKNRTFNSLEEFKNILKGNVEIPLLEERYHIVTSIAKVVNNKMNGNFYEYIKDITIFMLYFY